MLALLAFIGAPTLAAGSIPQPTAPQLAWQKGEIMALVHFNMATFFRNGDPGCDAGNWNESQKPSSFAPTELDTDNWAEAMTALGVHEAVLTAKHGCGFCLWPTKATLPDGTPCAAAASAALRRPEQQ